MLVSIPYDGDSLTIEIPDHRIAGVHGPNAPVLPEGTPRGGRSCDLSLDGAADGERSPAAVEPSATTRDGVVDEQRQIVAAAVAAPVGASTLDGILAGAARVVIVVNDHARPTPTSVVLDVLAEGGALDRATILVATGTHRASTPDELAVILGRYAATLGPKTVFHDADDQASLVEVGTTSRGTTVAVHRALVEADALVVIGSVEPHYFAGFTGGRKSLVPGCAGRATIEANHSHAMAREALPLALEGNPVHDDLVEAVAYLGDKPLFSVQLVLGDEREVVAAAAGGLEESFAEAVAVSERRYGVPMGGTSEVVVAVASSPLDIDLYQTQKAWEHGMIALMDGGVLVVVSACRDGVGPDHFFRMLAGYHRPEDVLTDAATTRYRLGYHKVVRLSALCSRSEVWALTTLDDATVEQVFMRPVRDLQQAVEEALDRMGPESKVRIILDASHQVPLLRRS